MNCREARGALARAPEQRANWPEELTLHVSECLGCQQLYRELEATWEALDCLHEVEPSADFRARFWERVQEGDRPRPWFTVWGPGIGSWTPGRAFAVIVLLFAVVGSSYLLVHRPGGHPLISEVVGGEEFAEDELLLRSLNRITRTPAASSLEVYDLWEVSTRDLDFAIGSLDTPEDETPSKKRVG